MRPQVLLALLATTMLPFVASAAPVTAYSVTDSIAGPDGSWDYASVDASGTHAFVARGDSVTVVDLRTGLVTSEGSLQRAHAAVPLPDGKLLVTSGKDGTVRLLDAAGRETVSIVVGKKPDAAILDSARTNAYVMNADSGSVSVIDLASAKIVKTIEVKPALEYAAFGLDRMLFINNEDADEIETVDVALGVVGKPIPLSGCKGPTGLGYDKAHDRLIASCANGMAAIVDAHSHRLTALIGIGSGPDAVILDEVRGLAFIPCGRDGVVDILSIAGKTVRHVATVKTEIGARTGALDPKTGALYLPTAKSVPPVTAGGRPATVPGTFHILVVRPSV